MPFLMINLDDPADCKRGMMAIRQRLEHVERECKPGPRGRKKGGRGRHRHGPPEWDEREGVEAKTPLKKKLMQIRQRGVWKHLVAVAELDETPMSLAELDDALDLPKNKFRSLKAIMAKLENRLGVQFLKADDSDGQDDAGNPRYLMPRRIRKAILKIESDHR